MTTFSSPKFTMPAEWAPHDSVWTAWPSHSDLWQENLPAVQAEFVDLCTAIADVHSETKKTQGDKLQILVHPDFPEQIDLAKAHLAKLPVNFHAIPYGDIWLRDTAPIFLQGDNNTIQALQLSFNGWGGKYRLEFDPEVAERIIAASGFPTKKIPWIAEGGALEFDGEGTCLTSEQCLLAKNRNPTLSKNQIENIICENFGIEKVLWVSEGLLNDHTDGHIDTIARFVAPGKVLVMAASDDTDPNAATLEKLYQELSVMTDARGRQLEVIKIPSPGLMLSEDENIMPASYLNFYISNSTVVVPTYGLPQDEKAVSAIAEHFPKHRTIGSSARALLSGGGAFHCITQQQPAPSK